jgi:hypothetical protein
LQILNERIIRWLERKGWIEKDPVKSALKQLRIVSIFYTIAIVGLLLVRLPAFTNIISPQEIQSAEKANELQEDLHKMKEVIYWGFIIITCWFWAGYNVLKELIGRMAKESDQEAAGTPSNLRMQRRPRSGF